MSKIKISELAKELGVEGKEVVSFLQEKGVESAKRSTSSVEDEDAELARKHFGKKGGAAVKEDKPVKAEKESKAEVKASEDKKSETEAKEDKNTITAEKTPKAGQASADNQPKKKKKIIIVSNQGNARGNSFGSSHSSAAS